MNCKKLESEPPNSPPSNNSSEGRYFRAAQGFSCFHAFPPVLASAQRTIRTIIMPERNGSYVSGQMWYALLTVLRVYRKDASYRAGVRSCSGARIIENGKGAF